MRWRPWSRRKKSETPANARTLFPPKFSTADIAATLHQIEEDYPDAAIVTLTDGYVAPPQGPSIDCRSRDFDALGRFATPLFLYACDSDEIGLPWIRELVRRRYRFYPVNSYIPSTYAHINDAARMTLETEYYEQVKAGFAKWDFGPGDFTNILQAIDITANVPGEYVEAGCYRGSSSCVAVRYMKTRGMARRCWFFDTFDGFSYEAARRSSDALWENTHATEGEEAIRARISRYADPDRGLEVRVERRNVIDEELPDGIRSIALANIDVDLYEAVKAALFKIAPRMEPRGIIIVEDAGHTPALIGSRLALQEFLASDAAAPFIAIYMESGQTFLVRSQ